ncbi:MAG: DUF4416 family protein [candidate division WOR-3 bacterium]
MDNNPVFPPLTKIFFGIIYKEQEGLSFVLNEISKIGKIDIQSPEIPFNFTDYYKDEMGDSLRRKWVSIEKVIPENELVKIKHKTLFWEKSLCVGDKRTVNCDPGGICDNRVVLVTTKNFSHRIYLGEGVFAEVTLIYKGTGFQPQAWTYPDYQSEIFLEFAMKCKKKFLEMKNNFRVK